VVAAIAAAFAVGFAGPVSAHVTVHSDNPTRGASDAVVTFRVPNEQNNATTTKLAVALPTDHPLLGVLVAPRPGWKSTVKNSTLNPPVKTDDGTVSEAVSQVTWTANSPADAIPVGGYSDFTVAAGQLPDDVSSLTFKALQTYSNGQIVRWIDVAAAGQPEGEHPAPVLNLGATSGAGTTSPSPGPTVSATSPSNPTASSRDTSDGTARALAGVGIGLAVLLSVGAYLLGRRRTPTS
jgi:uncharacterized protein YcnI